MKTITVAALVVETLLLGAAVFGIEETLPPLKDGKAPSSYDELWAGYDPKKEPLEIEVLKEWEEDGVVLRVVRFRIGIFKGQKAMMAAVYGFPKGGSKLPGLLQIHGGGQYGDYRAPLTNAKRGYATLSIGWAGRISAPGYQVDNGNVALFWEGKTNDSNYKVTTDWGALDAYQNPCRNKSKNAFSDDLGPAPFRLDPVDSPRNNGWFLCTLGARRGLTFLQQQPEVDPDNLGAYGHSMGGKLTVMTAAADSRVKAAAPSCGGLSDRISTNTLYRATIADDESLKRIKCPIIFLSPANDGHGYIHDLNKALGEIASREWRVTCSAYHQHQDTPQFQVAGPLWFDQYLKGRFSYPRTPETELTLKTASGSPLFKVVPDESRKILSVDVYYTQQIHNDEKLNREAAPLRFWHYAAPRKDGSAWVAELPLSADDKPLWVYANVLYPLDQPVGGSGYYYGIYSSMNFNVSSKMAIADADQLKGAGVKVIYKPTSVIETFEKDWQKEWFTYDIAKWARKTRKVYDPKYHAPASAKLSVEVLSKEANKLYIGLDQYAVEIALKGGAEWQSIVLTPGDFKNGDGEVLSSWDGIKELRLADMDVLESKKDSSKKHVVLFSQWKGPDPEFRNLKWIVNTKE